MKKTLKVAALMIVIVMAVFAFASCAKKLSGAYELDAGFLGTTTYEFDGNKYTKTYDPMAGDNEVEEGKYKIDEDAGTITFTYEVDGEEKTRTEDFVEGTEGDVEYIKIGSLQYTKK